VGMVANGKKMKINVRLKALSNMRV